LGVQWTRSDDACGSGWSGDKTRWEYVWQAKVECRISRVVWIRVSGELLLVKVGWRVCKADRLLFVARSAVPGVLADTHGFRWCFLPFARFSSSSKFFRRRSPFRLHDGLSDARLLSIPYFAIARISSFAGYVRGSEWR
jgi:hypothetical protein